MSAQTPTAKDLALRLFEALNTGDYDKLDDILDENTVAEWPQSKERVRGRANLKAIFENYPGGSVGTQPETVEFVDGDEGSYLLTPMFTAVRAEGAGDHAVAAVKTQYPDGSLWYLVTVVRARNGKIISNQTYFAPMYDAPEWRAQWVEHMD